MPTNSTIPGNSHYAGALFLAFSPFFIIFCLFLAGIDYMCVKQACCESIQCCRRRRQRPVPGRLRRSRRFPVLRRTESQEMADSSDSLDQIMLSTRPVQVAPRTHQRPQRTQLRTVPEVDSNTVIFPWVQVSQDHPPSYEEAQSLCARPSTSDPRSLSNMSAIGEETPMLRSVSFADQPEGNRNATDEGNYRGPQPSAPPQGEVEGQYRYSGSLLFVPHVKYPTPPHVIVVSKNEPNESN